MIEIQSAVFVGFLVTAFLAVLTASLILFPRLYAPRCIICFEPLTDQELDSPIVMAQEPMLWYARICSRCTLRRRLAAAERKI